MQFSLWIPCFFFEHTINKNELKLIINLSTHVLIFLEKLLKFCYKTNKDDIIVKSIDRI